MFPYSADNGQAAVLTVASALCRHVDMHTEGTERCAKALDTAVQLPEARELFDESFDRFRDVTCVGLCNWANTHVCLGKKLVEAAAAAGGKLDDVRAEFGEHMQQAIKRYNEALGFNGARAHTSHRILLLKPPLTTSGILFAHSRA